MHEPIVPAGYVAACLGFDLVYTAAAFAVLRSEAAR